MQIVPNLQCARRNPCLAEGADIIGAAGKLTRRIIPGIMESDGELSGIKPWTSEPVWFSSLPWVYPKFPRQHRLECLLH